MIAAFQWDLARQPERLDWLVAQLPRYAEWGYREVYLHLEDAVEFPSLPGVARRGAYTRRQLGRLVDAAARAGIGVVPIINLLGHTQYLIKVPELRDLNELRADGGSPLTQGQVCPVHPRILEVADSLVGDMAPFCTAGKVHVGLDESFSLGRHPLSAADIAQVGLARHFAGYVQRLEGVAKGHRLRLGMWADMLALIPEAIPHLPQGIITYDWYYYPFGRLPRIELRNFREYDLVPALRERGIEYWGCPMNGSFRHEPLPVFGERLANIRDWWRRCADVDAAGMLVTSWEPNRLAVELTTLVDASAASLWLEPGDVELSSMLERGFARAFGGAGSRELSRDALACDERAFAGHSRWEINEHWDSCATRLGVSRFEAEQGFFRRLASKGRSLPAPMLASAQFRLYLAERDIYVRSTAAAIFALRRMCAKGGPGDPRVSRGIEALRRHAGTFTAALGPGRRAARRMWDRTRDRRVLGPNERMVERDGERLAALKGWISAAAADPSRVFRASPVCGAWQLIFEVLLSEPALQRVVVEERGPDRVWRLVRARTTIEFRAQAARPRASVRREFSVPIGGPSGRLRIGARGLGRVGLSNIALTDGVSSLRPRGWPASRTLLIGKAAPAKGFPDLDWGTNAGAVELSFASPRR